MFSLHTIQKRNKTRLRRRDLELRTWPKQKKHWLKPCGAGLALQRELERPSVHVTVYSTLLSPTFSGLLALVFWWRAFLFFSDSSYSLLADDVLGSYLLCPHPKKPKCGSLIIRFPSGLVTHLIENTRKGKYLIEVKCFNKLNGLPS